MTTTNEERDARDQRALDRLVALARHVEAEYAAICAARDLGQWFGPDVASCAEHAAREAKRDRAERAANQIACVGAAFRESIDPRWGGRLRAKVGAELGQ